MRVFFAAAVCSALRYSAVLPSPNPRAPVNNDARGRIRRLIGRVDMKADRKTGTLNVRRLWWERGVRASSGRMDKLMAELARIARFAGVEKVVLADDWMAL